MTSTYNGSLTREQFLFYEIRQAAALLADGLSREEALKKIKEDNLFQFPTERMITNIASVCFRRLDALESASLQRQIARGSQEVAKQINLYAMMRYNRIVWDFMITLIGEKFRTREPELTAKDMNLFFFRLREQEESVGAWSESTITKIRQVLKRSLIECGYLDGPKSETLNPVYLFPELEEGIRENGDDVAFAAFNYFE